MAAGALDRKAFCSPLCGGSIVVERYQNRQAAVAQTESGTTITVSSFGELTERQKRAVANTMGIEITRDIGAVEAFYEAHKKELAINGYEPIGHMSDPIGKPGLHHLTHAEKQATIVSGATALGVSKEVCTRDCQPFFFALAKVTASTYTIADPAGTYIFYPNGNPKFLPHSSEEP